MQKKANGQIGLSLFILLGVASVLIMCYFAIPDFQHFVNEMFHVLMSGDEQRITEYFKGFGAWGPIMFVVVTIVQMFFIVFPIWIIMLVAVLAYGWVWGTFISIGSLLIASTVGFFIGVALGERIVRKLFGEERRKKMQNAVSRYGFATVILFRMSPLFSSDAISFVAGMVGMRYWRYMAATLIGVAPLAVIVAYFGQETHELKEGMWWLGGLGIVVYAGYIIFQRFFKRRKPQRKEA